jgi:hypothetical protein
MISAQQGEGFPVFHTFTALEWRLTEVFRRMWLIPVEVGQIKAPEWARSIAKLNLEQAKQSQTIRLKPNSAFPSALSPLSVAHQNTGSRPLFVRRHSDVSLSKKWRTHPSRIVVPSCCCSFSTALGFYTTNVRPCCPLSFVFFRSGASRRVLSHRILSTIYGHPKGRGVSSLTCPKKQF